MRSDLMGQRPVVLAVTRAGLLSVSMLLGIGLSACTTTEGTNAMTDFGTFEREVMTSTAIGFGIVDKPPAKEEPTSPRAPLVLPKDDRSLPPPTTEDVSMLPEDSKTVQIDTTGLTDADLRRLRNARVVDLHTVDGRPLTAEESKKLTARMIAARTSTAKRSLFTPPEEYFTTVKGQDLVCLAPNGDLVPVTDPSCPPEIKTALSKN